MRFRNIAVFAAAVFAGALGGSIIGPRPAEAVAREIIDTAARRHHASAGSKRHHTQMTQDHTVLKTLLEQATDSVNKLNTTMGSVQKSVQDVQANSGTRLDTMSTQVQGLSDNLEEIKSRIGKLNQQLVDLQSSVQNIDARFAGNAPTTTPTGNTTPMPSTVPPSPTGAVSRLPRLLRLLWPLPLPPPTCSTPTACATSPAANTISPAPNFRTI